MNKFELILRERLEDLRDEAYGDFVAKGIPGVPREKILGVRVPEIRGATAYALGEIFPTEFLQDLPHYFLEYDYAHAEIISQMNNFEECVSELNKFLPYVNNWAVCDTMNPKIFRKNLDKVLPLAFEWMESGERKRLDGGRAILCADDGGLVFCNSACQTMGGGARGFDRGEIASLDT